MAWVPVQVSGTETEEKTKKPTAQDFIKKWMRLIGNDPFMAKLFAPLLLYEATTLRISSAEAMKVEAFVSQVTAMAQAAQTEPDEENKYLAWPYG